MRRMVSIAVLVAGGLALCSQAHAANTIGEAYDSGSGGTACSYGGTYIQSASAGNSYAAPYDGVITSWGSRNRWPTITFKVVRVGSNGSYTVLASDGPRTHGPSRDLETHPVRISVRQGDVIGGHIPPANHLCLHTPAGYAVGSDDADVPAGSVGGFDSTFDGKVPIEATIERDRDGDGFGDDTQDACPTDGSTQGPCPLPTTLGETFTPFSSGCNGPFTAVVVASPGVVSAAPHDGVITAWNHDGGLASTVSGQISLKTFRPLGGADFTVVGQSQPQTVVALTRNTYSARVPVRQGDRIGVGVTGGQVSCGSGPLQTDHVRGFVGEDVPLGSSATFALGNTKVDISALLEADADGDGFGDTSQDACATDASTQATCPAGPSDACESARKKLKRAKAKLKKLKRKDASAKKLKAAKQKVKKAKAKVKRVC